MVDASGRNPEEGKTDVRTEMWTVWANGVCARVHVYTYVCRRVRPKEKTYRPRLWKRWWSKVNLHLLPKRRENGYGCNCKYDYELIE